MRLFGIVFSLLVIVPAMLISKIDGVLLGLSAFLLSTFFGPLFLMFLLSALSTKINPTGILMATLFAFIPPCLRNGYVERFIKLISIVLMRQSTAILRYQSSLSDTRIVGYIFFPQPPGYSNFVQHSTIGCADISFKPLNDTSDTSSYLPAWVEIFWISRIGWNAFFVLAVFTVTGWKKLLNFNIT